MNLQATSGPALHEPSAVLFAGWHDSSFDLREGLVVTEHGELDGLSEAPEFCAAWSAASIARDGCLPA